MLGAEPISFVDLELRDDARRLVAGPQLVGLRLVLVHEIAHIRDLIRAAGAEILSSRLTSSLPAGLPHQAVSAAQASVGGAVEAAHRVAQAGLGQVARQLSDAGVLAFLHSFAGGCLVASGIAALGAIVAAMWLPARPLVHHAGPGRRADRPARW